MLDKDPLNEHILRRSAEVAELVDALGSGSSWGFPVEVRVFSSAPSLQSSDFSLRTFKPAYLSGMRAFCFSTGKNDPGMALRAVCLYGTPQTLSFKNISRQHSPWRYSDKLSVGAKNLSPFPPRQSQPPRRRDDSTNPLPISPPAVQSVSCIASANSLKSDQNGSAQHIISTTGYRSSSLQERHTVRPTKYAAL